LLALAQRHGRYTLSSCDYGCPLPNGARERGHLLSFPTRRSSDLTANDSITVSLGEVSGSGFSPRLRLQGPDGSSLGDVYDTNGINVTVRATASGTYTVLVSNKFRDNQVGNASYILTLAKTPGPYT